jgi:hypothetical protein
MACASGSSADIAERNNGAPPGGSMQHERDMECSKESPGVCRGFKGGRKQHLEGSPGARYSSPRHKGADRDSSLLAKRHLPARDSPKTYRLDNGHCAGADENQVPASQRKTPTKACEQGKCDQLPQAWRHFHTASDLNRVKGAPRTRRAGSDGPGLGHDATG